MKPTPEPLTYITFLSAGIRAFKKMRQEATKAERALRDAVARGAAEGIRKLLARNKEERDD
jgi:hypothetical protein